MTSTTLTDNRDSAGASPSEPLKGKAATQRRILEAAAGLFVKQGFDGTTIADVAETAGVSRATVFWHFSDKAGLFREAFSFLVRPFRESLERDLGDLSPEKRLLEQLGHYQNMSRVHRETIEGFLQWAVETAATREWLLGSLLDLHQRFTGILSETLTELLPEGQDPGAVAAGLVAMLDGVLVLSLFDKSEPAGEQRRAGAEAIASLICSAARPDPPR
jgi:AcrR family transcriptional regulator